MTSKRERYLRTVGSERSNIKEQTTPEDATGVDSEVPESEEADTPDVTISLDTPDVTISLFSWRTHLFSILTALLGSGGLFLVVAPIYTSFSPLPATPNVYATEQFTPSVWGTLIGSSAVVTSVSGAIWYRAVAPKKLRSRLDGLGFTLLRLLGHVVLNLVILLFAIIAILFSIIEVSVLGLDTSLLVVSLTIILLISIFKHTSDCLFSV